MQFLILLAETSQTQTITWAAVGGAAVTAAISRVGLVFRWLNRKDRIKQEAADRRHYRKQENMLVLRLQEDIDQLRQDLRQVSDRNVAALTQISALQTKVAMLERDLAHEKHLKHTYRDAAQVLVAHIVTLELDMEKAGMQFAPLDSKVIDVFKG